MARISGSRFGAYPNHMHIQIIVKKKKKKKKKLVDKKKKTENKSRNKITTAQIRG
jgi:hypothetical protein